MRNKCPHAKTLPNNWRDLLRWHGELEGATKDEIAWRSRQLPFDNKNKMKELATRFKFDIGVGYANRNKSGWVETLNKHSKRLTQKTTQDKRRSTHGKLLNSASTNNKTPKKNNPEQTTILKRKMGSFDPNNFVHFQVEDGIGAFNDWITEHGGMTNTRFLLQLFLLVKNQGHR